MPEVGVGAYQLGGAASAKGVGGHLLVFHPGGGQIFPEHVAECHSRIRPAGGSEKKGLGCSVAGEKRANSTQIGFKVTQSRFSHGNDAFFAAFAEDSHGPVV